MKRLITFFLLIPLIFVAGCSKQPTWRIGVSQCSDDDWRKKMNEEIMREALLLGDSVTVEIRSGDDTNSRQIADLEYFRDNNFDLIAVAPNEAEALTPVIADLAAAGIPVIVFDRSVNTDAFTAFQGADNLALGRMAALQAWHFRGPDARVLELRGLDASTPAAHRRDGFHAAADSLGMTIVASVGARWNYDDALAATDSLLRVHPDINVVYAHNDRMAIGASEAASRLGMRGRLSIIGIDAAPAIGTQAVADGTIDATFIYPTEGQTLLQTAMAILTNRPFERVTLFPTPAAIDASNAELFLLQDHALRRETEKIATLKSRIDLFWQQHTLQTILLYSTIIIVVLLAVVLYLLQKAYWTHRRNRENLEEKNAELQARSDELHSLYNKLEEATRSKLTFFTNVSHDLRTPLTLIADPVHQLAAAENLTPQQHTLMQLADKNVKRLTRLVNQILDIRKFDSGQLHLDLADVDLAEALREWCAPFADVAARRHLRFLLQIEPGADFRIAIDAEKLERVLFNLISNAFKFTPANGHVTVSLDRLPNAVRLTVSDTGIGMKKEELDQVFDRFFKADSDINPNGSGIGLALSKEFVAMHGGDITAESEPGKGTSFAVTLPMRIVGSEPSSAVAQTRPADDADELAAVIAPEAEEPAEDLPTVLVIDDNPDISVLVKTILGETYSVISANSGAQGIRLAVKYVPDLIVCDVMMPGIDGYETCRRLKAEPVTCHIPVLLLTACSQEQQRTEGYQCGADGYMSKPFDSEMLLARCRNLIDNRRLIRQNHAESPTAAPTATPASDGSPTTIDDEFYQRFIAVVEARMAESDLSVEDIASDVGLSRVQMYRKIKALTNFSPAEVLRNCRLNRARRLLASSQRTVAEIAYEVGFNSPGYFAKCYREYFRESPTDTQSHTSKFSS